MPSIACLGDSSSHGGVIVSAGSKLKVNGKLAARKGDMHVCPLPFHGTTPISAGSGSVTSEGQPIARTGDTAGCGASLIGTGGSTTAG